MNRRSLLLAAAAGTLAAPAIHAQGTWPQGKPIRVIVPWPPGAANDTLGRLFAARLSEKLGATAVPENRTGGAGLVGTNAVLTAAPDGYTFLASAFNTAVMPLVLKGATFDPQKDLEVCARTAQAPMVFAITGQRPQTTLAEVIAAAKAKPRDWNFAITSLGSASHLATIDFLRRTGLDLDMVSYRGTQPAVADLMGGSVQLLIDPSSNLLPARAPGRLNVLAIASKERSALAPEVPTMAEAGVPLEAQSWYGVWAPKGTSPEICQRVNDLMQETMRDPAVIQRMATQVLEPVTESIAESRAFIGREIERATVLLKSVNYQPE
ncbi:Bug family tripartite tricarboxylate transporter substrate binding protein [Pararoseomonas indoligenes]|uniref:Tripartite tricarboxylate transporter substrate binding protein n=1 Tax=Roseomonas indoligenes TaxID=2820811 RepID=A0A940S8W6_9PROT|nr:tripartite tricarboxylate transporter substrate binding protein [Pararoseomonas indoligenes]MBP0494623.1 tripartite tricarboxylate transporter substrate binding protein [Pararoseomonas indoligenes]